MEAKKDVGGAQIVTLPDELAVGADYGLTVIADAPSDAYRFAMSILSADGQQILARYGFSAPALPQ
jgi:ABC-type molybdate transport system substrate-binding protein